MAELRPLADEIEDTFGISPEVPVWRWSTLSARRGSVSEPINARRTTLAEIVAEVKGTRWLEVCTKIRNADGDPARRTKLKETLPVWRADLAACLFDVDNIDGLPEEIRHSFAAGWRSPSRTGGHLVALADGLSEENYRATHAQIAAASGLAAHCERVGGTWADRKDANGVLFVGHDVAAWLAAEPRVWNAVAADPESPLRNLNSGRSPGPWDFDAVAFADGVVIAPGSLGEGTRNSGMVKLLGYWWAHPLYGRQFNEDGAAWLSYARSANDIYCSPTLSSDEVEAAAGSVARYPGADSDSTGPNGSTAHKPDGLTAAYDRAGFAAVIESAEAVLRYNIRAARAEITDTPPRHEAWRPLTDREEAALRGWAAENWEAPRGLKEKDRRRKPWKPAGTDWETLKLAHLHEREVDPLLDWLEDLPPWDGKPRLDHLLAALFSDVSPDDRLAHWASSYVFLGAVQRAYDPGSKLDEVPVLIATQGAGKSAYAAHTLPPWSHGDWFNDQIDLNARGKEKAESLAGRVVVELSEMTGATRSDVEHLKSFLTRQDDGGHRAAYARNTEPAPRRCVFVGTGDKAGLLPNDSAGNRRFVVVEVGRARGRIEGALGNIREQLWAEAAFRHSRGERANLPRGLAPLQAERNEAHRNHDALIEDAIAEVAAAMTGSTISGLDLSSAVNRKTGVTVTWRRLSAACKAQGWTRHHTKMGTLWTPPTGDR